MNVQITPEDWEAWREHPITQLVMSGFEHAAERAKAQWQADAWSNEYLGAEGRERQLIALNRVKARCDAYGEIQGISLQDVLAANGLEQAQEGQ